MYGGTPPPSQRFVDSQLQSNCPMVYFEHKLDIFPPLCGETQGVWIDPTKNRNRTVLRWENKGHSGDPYALSDKGHGLHFSVDSAITGNGSTTFINVDPQVVLRGYKFSLLNCLGLSRYSIDESIIKIDRMGAHDSTSEQRDPHYDHTEYFFQYSVMKDDTVVLQTDRFRMFSDNVNFSLVEGDGLT